MWWPSSSDPYYLFNVSENTTRNNYYGNNYAPHFYIDGNIDGEANRGAWETMIDNESFNVSSLAMQLTGNYEDSTRQGNINVRIITESSPGLSYLRLRIALVEDYINWRGPNGTTIHNQTFRDMIPNTGGEALTLIPGDTVNYSYPFTLAPALAEENCKLIAFVQSNQNRYILQGARIGVLELNETSVDEGGAIPHTLQLSQNYPNPFNAQTNIEFELSHSSDVNLAVYDITGAKIATLLDGHREAGRYEIIWDAGQVASGVYFYSLNVNGLEQTRKMTLLK